NEAAEGGPVPRRRTPRRHDRVAPGPKPAVADDLVSGRRYEGRDRRRDAEDRPRPAKNKGVLHELSCHGRDEGGGDDVAKAEGPVAEYQAHRVEVPAVALAGLWLALLPAAGVRSEGSPDRHRPDKRDDPEPLPRPRRHGATLHQGDTH